MIASHYAEPVDRLLVTRATLRAEASEAAPALSELKAGTNFALLDDSRGWAWGYAGDEGLVGYVPSSALA